MCLISTKSALFRRLFRRRFRSRFLLLLVFLVVSLVSISSLGPGGFRISQANNLFLNHQQYFSLLREKYPSQKSESFCQTDLLLFDTVRAEPVKVDSTAASHPVCSDASLNEWISFDRFGRMSIDRDALKHQGIGQIEFCEYADVKWSGDDYGFEVSEFVRIEEGGRVRQGTEFFHVRCKSESNEYTQVFARIFDDDNENM